MNVVFRCDASLLIGSGHVMRCLTLADALREKGCTCQFVCRNHLGNLSTLIQEKGYRVTLLPLQEFEVEAYPHHAAWVGADWQTDAKETRALITTLETPPAWLVVDHYGLDARWETSLRPAVGRIFVIDDLADRPHDCDLLLDQNLVANRALRYMGKVPKHAGLMLGPEYALLQPQYADLHLRVPPREGPVRRVLVFFGGADADNLTGRVIAAFLSLKVETVVLEVVINPDSAHAESIRNQVFGNGQIILHERLASLAPVIVRADLAIGAGGATSWERCCLGLPALVITLAENQKPIAEEMQQENLIHWLGHKNEVSEMILAEVMQKLFSAGLATDWSLRCLNRVDGHGAERVTSFLLLNAQTVLKARLARLDDESLILQWANDPLVRENAFTLDPISLGTHQSWYRSRLRELDQCRFYIVETLAGFPVGQVRFERSGEAWEIHYGLDARARGQKLGKPLLRSAILALRSSTNEALLFARVKGSNISSCRVFESLEFSREDAGGGQGGLSIAICSDVESWMNASIPDLLLGWLEGGSNVAWCHNAKDLPGGDFCFYLSYGRIVGATTLSLYSHNLVVHASDLPKGRGWSPASWQILEGRDRIPVTLLEAVGTVDAGRIYLQEWVDLSGIEIADDWRSLLARATINLSQAFVAQYPDILGEAREQEGEATSYARRRAKDSELDAHKTLTEQFNNLRIVDNEHYPAFFNFNGQQFILKIFKSKNLH